MSSTPDREKDYVGKVVKVYYNSNNEECSQTGIVFAQQTTSANYLKLSMLLTNGQVCDPIPFAITKVTSTRIDPSLRKALEQYCAAKVAQDKFLRRFWSEKADHDEKVARALSEVKEHSNEVTYDTFMMTAERIFRDRWPSTNDNWRACYFECGSISPKSITMRQVQQIEKYADPEKYDFLYREYDGNLFLDYTHPQCASFCQRNAPPIIPALAEHAKTTVSASIGDKNWLSVQRNYQFPLKYGLTKDSLNQLSDIVSGKVHQKPLENTLAEAKARSQALEQTIHPNDKGHKTR